ncbi:MAG: hypothetical protein NC548_48060 [Lachnospiraceae bacterium]|nr:hypothetical protein [Lachnospiraceae bacterium]MCM1234420.1 hypothetical protein [Ruminococcus flavefaciens]
MHFIFEDGCQSTEALITAMKYDSNKSMYEMTVLGIDKDSLSYTNSGKAWFEKEELKELINGKKLESEFCLISRKIKLISNSTLSNKKSF